MEPFPRDSAHLIQLVCDGTREGELFFRRRFERGARSLCRYQVPAENIDQCLDQIFADAFSGIRAREFQSFDCLASYLRHVLKQVVARFAQRKASDLTGDVAFDSQPLILPPETVARYRAAVTQLAVNERNCLYAYYVDCKSHESIAREMGVSVTDVLLLKKRAKQTLNILVRTGPRAAYGTSDSSEDSINEMIPHPQFFTAQ